MIHPALVACPEAWAPGRAGRIGAAVRPLLQAEQLGPGDVVLIGLCNEVGVLANGGRPGTAEGPQAFRGALGRLSEGCLQGHAFWDAGDVPASAAYADFLDAAEVTVAAAVRRGALPILIGGGHDCSFGAYRGLAALEAFSPLRPPAVIAIDAHLDVRPEPGPSSGNPFFKMLEHGLPGEDLALLGLIPFVNAPDHEAYARGRGATLHFLEPGGEAQVVTEARAALTRFLGRGRRVLATFDLDAFGAAWAPGVSAVNPWGLSADTGLQLAQAFGAHPSVAVLDLMEYAPRHDRDGQTARLMAFLVAAFLQARNRCAP